MRHPHDLLIALFFISSTLITQGCPQFRTEQCLNRAEEITVSAQQTGQILTITWDQSEWDYIGTSEVLIIRPYDPAEDDGEIIWNQYISDLDPPLEFDNMLQNGDLALATGDVFHVRLRMTCNSGIFPNTQITLVWGG